MSTNFEILDKKTMNSIKGGLFIEHITYRPHTILEENENPKEEKNNSNDTSSKEIS